MSVNERKARERARRHRLIITAAREIAEAEGWEAVTTRRLAERVEYSQPVLYGHFDGKDAIRDAVAIEGFGEMREALRRARLSVPAGEALRATCGAYLEFAAAHPALYEAMFMLPTGTKFASDETPAPLRAAFGELVASFGPENETNTALAELVWSSLHGMVVLAAGSRMPADAQGRRLDLLVSLFSGAAAREDA